jgi:hypothetical protein
MGVQGRGLTPHRGDSAQPSVASVAEFHADVLPPTPDSLLPPPCHTPVIGDSLTPLPSLISSLVCSSQSSHRPKQVFGSGR